MRQSKEYVNSTPENSIKGSNSLLIDRITAMDSNISNPDEGVLRSFQMSLFLAVIIQ